MFKHDWLLKGIWLALGAALGLFSMSPVSATQDAEAMEERAGKAIKGRIIASEELTRRVEAARNAFRSPEFQTLQNQMRDRLMVNLGVEDQLKEEGEEELVEILPSNIPALFVSSSIPTHILRNYARDLERTRGVMVFRGLPGGVGKMGPFAELVRNILLVDATCQDNARTTCDLRDVRVLVDPFLFRAHGLGEVPAMAVLSGKIVMRYCERPGETEAPTGRLVFGDASLAAMLGRLSEIEGSSAKIDPILKRLEVQL